jgi:hypothetical protein
MSNAITPSEQELAAYDEVNEAIYNPTQPTISGERYRRAAIIATHTRYEGKTAKEWNGMYSALIAQRTVEAAYQENWKQRAEALQARVKELEAGKRTAQAEALRWAAAHCGNMGSASVLRQYAAAVERGEVTLP